MYMIDIRWIFLTVAVIGAGVAAALVPSLINPILASAAVGTLLWVVLRPGSLPPT